MLVRVPALQPETCLRNSSARLRMSGAPTKPRITATESAPAAIADRAFSRVIPPMATTGEAILTDGGTMAALSVGTLDVSAFGF